VWTWGSEHALPPRIYIVTCYLLTRRIISGLRILYLDLLDIHQAELQLVITFPNTSHKPVSSSGSSFVSNWRKLFLRSFRDELLWWTAVTNSLRNQSLTAFIISAINCWSVRCQDMCVLTDRYLLVTIPHCSGCRGYLAYRTVESNLVASVDTQFAWIMYPSRGNGYLPPWTTRASRQHVTILWRV
jgi:hypothetical protein